MSCIVRWGARSSYARSVQSIVRISELNPAGISSVHLALLLGRYAYIFGGLIFITY